MSPRKDNKIKYQRGSRPQFNRKRNKVIGAILIFCLLWIFYRLILYIISDPCGGKLYVKKLCAEYWNGNAGGNMCHEICQEKYQYISHCYHDLYEQRVYHFNRTSATKVLLKYLNTPEKSLDNAYRFPEHGTDMSIFHNHVKNFVKNKLGPGNHDDIIKEIFKFGDLNRDSKMSLAEARSVWSLLQINDFFMSVVFKDSHHVPNIIGYCGDTYISELIPEAPLYQPINKKGIYKWKFPIMHTMFWPSWGHRVKLSVGLLELAIEAFQHGKEGMFYLCNISESSIGYTPNFEPKLLDLSFMLAKYDFGRRLKDRTCKINDDCIYTTQCIAKCDIQSQKCSYEIIRPSLYYICHIIKPFILPGLPKAITGDFLNLLERCERLHIDMPDLALQHSLVYTDMKSLLWRQISNAII